MNCKFNSRLVFAFIVVSFCITQQVTAQSIKRQSVACGGTSSSINGISFQQTIGQPYNTASYSSSELSCLQGFQQPASYKVEKISSTTNFNLIVFPNPVINLVTIQSAQLITNATLLVADVSGKLLFSEKFAEFKSYSLNCETWQSGVYIISISDTKNNSFSSKLILTK